MTLLPPKDVSLTTWHPSTWHVSVYRINFLDGTFIFVQDNSHHLASLCLQEKTSSAFDISLHVTYFFSNTSPENTSVCLQSLTLEIPFSSCDNTHSLSLSQSPSLSTKHLSPHDTLYMTSLLPQWEQIEITANEEDSVACEIPEGYSKISKAWLLFKFVKVLTPI